MAYLTNLYSNSLSNQSLATALLLGTYTNTTRLRKIYIDVFADQIAGNGNYTVYATRQRAGAGSAFEVGARTTVPVPSGITAQHFPTLALSAGATDVIKCYLVGLAGDTTTPDTIMEVSEEFVLTDASGQVTFANTSIATVTTLTNAPSDSAGITTLLARIVGTLLTGNHNPQSGDAYARVGAAGAGLTALGDTRIANLDATVSSRLATASYTAPLDAAAVRSAVGLASANLDTQLTAIDDYLDTEIAAIKTKTDQLTFTTLNQVDATAVTVSDKTGYTLTTPPLDAAATRAAIGLASANLDTQLDTLPTANENAAALLDLTNGIETGLTPRQALKIIAAATGGEVSGADTLTIVFRNAVADSKNRITATVDEFGNRTAITYDLT